MLLLKVASVLRVSTLKDWIFKSYSKGFLNKGLEGLKSVCSLFLFSKPQNDETSQNLNNENTPKTPSSAHSNDNFDFTKNLFASSQDAPNIESIQFKRDKEIEAEILITLLFGHLKHYFQLCWQLCNTIKRLDTICEWQCRSQYRCDAVGSNLRHIRRRLLDV